MKATLLIAFLGLGLIIFARADDDALTADSTADQVADVMDHEAKAIARKYPEFNYPECPIDSTREAVALAGKLEALPTKVILDVLSQTKPYGKEYDPRLYIKRQALFNALSNNIKEADLADLLASQTTEALWVICAHSGWNSSPALITFLTAQLQQMPSSQSDDDLPGWALNGFIPTMASNFTVPSQGWKPGETWQWTVLNLAGNNDSPDIQKQLADTIRAALDKSGSHALFFCDALEVVSRSHNPQLYGEASDLIARLNTSEKYPFSHVYQCVDRLIDAHPDLLKDPQFVSRAIPFIKNANFGWGYDGKILLARLGDSMTFIDLIANYFNKDYLPYPDMPESSRDSARKEFNHSVESEIYEKIAFHGSGDRDQGIKSYYRTAAFQDGHWVVTDPTDDVWKQKATGDLMASSPTPTPAPVAKPHPNADKLSAALDKALASIPNPAAEPPNRVTIIVRGPIETIDGSGNVTAVSMSTVGTNYDVVRVDGSDFILKDASGKQYRIGSQSTRAIPATGDTASATATDAK